MANGKLTIEIDGNELAAVKAYTNLSKEQRKSTDAIVKGGEAAKKAAQKAIDAQKSELAARKKQISTAKQVVKANESIEETYEREKTALKQARDDGIISTEQYRATLDRLTVKLEQSGDAALHAARVQADASREAKQATDEQVRFAKNLVREHERIEDSYERERDALVEARKQGKITYDEYKRGLDGVRQKHFGVQQVSKDTFGSRSIARIQSYVASIFTIQAAFNAARRAAEFFNEEQEKAKGETTTLSEQRTRLRQVSRGDFEELEKRSDRLATDNRLGITREQARELVFAARSTGFEGEERDVAAANIVIPVAAGAAFAGEFRKFFGAEGLSVEQAFNTALSGAAESKFDINQLLPQIQKASQGAVAGGESSDIVAATALLASNFDRATGQFIRGLGIKLATNDETRGLNLIEAVKKLQSDPELRQDITGGSQEQIALVSKFIERLPEIERADRRIEQEQRTTGESGLISKAIAEALDRNTTTGRIELSRFNQIATEQRELIRLEREFAERAFTTDAARSNLRDRAVANRDNLALRAARDAATGTVATFGGGPQGVRDANRFIDSAQSAATGRLNKSTEDAIRDLGAARSQLKNDPNLSTDDRLQLQQAIIQNANALIQQNQLGAKNNELLKEMVKNTRQQINVRGVR